MLLQRRQSSQKRTGCISALTCGVIKYVTPPPHTHTHTHKYSHNHTCGERQTADRDRHRHRQTDRERKRKRERERVGGAGGGGGGEWREKVEREVKKGEPVKNNDMSTTSDLSGMPCLALS